MDYPRVFISYARQDGEAYASALRARLEREQPEISLWQDRARLEGGIGWWKQITDALDQVEFLVLVMTPAAMQSAVARREWRYARQRGVCVYPVKGMPDAALDYGSLPQWMSKAHFFDLEREWDTFVHHLKSPCRAARVPFMAPDLPSGHVERGNLTARLIALLVDEARQNPLATTVSLYGAGGAGKTTLAVAVCHREEVVSAFDDGILWVTLGQNPSVQGAVTKLYAALTGQRPAFVDEDDAAFTLAERLEDKSCLIVIDDVWSLTHLAPFLRGARRCARLVTTRHFDIAAESVPVAIDEMSPSEAAHLLGSRLPEPGAEPETRGALRELAQRLGNWPLLLELASAALHQRIGRGDTLENALRYLNRRLDQEGVVAFDQHNASERHQALSRTLDVSLTTLDPEERSRCEALAVFPDDIDIPVAQASHLWACDAFTAEALIERFDSLSLLKLDLPAATFSLHGVLSSYLRRQLADPALLHARLVDAWGDRRQLASDYAWRWLPFHLVAARRAGHLRSLLLDFGWLQAKLVATDVTALLEDFGLLAEDRETQRVRGAVRLAAHVLVRDKAQLAGQVLGRLPPAVSPEIDALREAATRWSASPWLRPLEASLTEPGGPLLLTLSGHQGAVRTVAITPDGHRAVSGSDDCTVRVWDLTRGVEERVLRGHSDWVRAVAVLAEGCRAVSTGDDQTIRVWDTDTGSPGQVTEVPGQRPRALAALPDANRALVAGGGCHVVLVDVIRGEVLRIYRGHTATVNALAVTADGMHAVSASDDRTLRRWNLSDGAEELVLRGHCGKVVAAALSPDGRFVVTASSDDSLRRWPLQQDGGTGSREGTPITDAAYWVRALVLSPDGKQAITGADDGSVRAWDIESGTLTRIFEGHAGRIHAVAMTPDGGRAVSASEDRTLKVWDVRSGTLPRTRKGHDGRIRALVASGDGLLAVSTSIGSSEPLKDQQLKVWDLVTLREARAYEGHAPRPVALSRDGRRVVSASPRRYASLQVVDLATGEIQQVLKGHTDVLRAVALTPDGSRLASASDDGTLRVWDLASGETRITVPTGRHTVRALTTTPDGRQLLSASDDRTLRVWDLDTGQELARLVGHAGEVNDVAVSRDGRWAISASADTTIKLWDLARGIERVCLRGHEATVNGIAVDAQGEHVASVSDDRTVRVWRLSDGDLLAVFTGDSPMKACTAGRPGMIVAGDQSGGLHFLRLVLP